MDFSYYFLIVVPILIVLYMVYEYIHIWRKANKEYSQAIEKQNQCKAKLSQQEISSL